jgi:drug/metabolite transporter (DMT)-like permease
MSNIAAWGAVAFTVVLTIYGQMIIRWRAMGIILPPETGGKIRALFHLVLDPWVVSSLVGAVIAAICWMAAMTKLPLTSAYPFTIIPFVVVTVFSTALLHEPLGIIRIGGIAFIVSGLFMLLRA